MVDIFETLKASGNKLSPKQVIDEQITKVISSLYVFAQMLGEERKKEVDLIESFRTDLIRIRWALDEFIKEAK